jgi:hypothetical protein
MKAPKIYQVYNDLYLVNVLLAVGWDRGEVMQHFEQDIGRGQGAAIEIDAGVAIWIGSLDENWEGILCHESIHAANIILMQKGVKISTKNDEALTYLAQWIFERCLPICKKLAGSRQKKTRKLPG